MARANQRPSETSVRSSNLPTAPPSIAPSSPDLSSDKENHSTAPPRDKGKGRMQSTTSDSHSAKRRRTQSRNTAPVADHLDSDDESRFYDPTQDQHERQEVRRSPALSSASSMVLTSGSSTLMPSCLTSSRKQRCLPQRRQSARVCH
jgi:hypothetical protein